MISTKFTLAANETALFIPGPAGKIELITAEASAAKRRAFGVICHPHPLYGGTMHNKIVTTLAKTFQGLGVRTVRFNFRGIGESEGEYAHGVGELADLKVVIEWMQQSSVQDEIWLAGFSFGACIAAIAASQLPVQKLVTVAPAVGHLAMQNLPPITCPWVLVQGEKDDIVSPEAVLTWAQHREPQPVVLRFPQAGHFFHGQLSELRERIEAILNH